MIAQIDAMSKVVARVMRERTTTELAIGWVRYEALRKLKPLQYTELCRRNLNGEFFDWMVDELVVKEVTP